MAKRSAFGSAATKRAPSSKGPSGPIFVCADLKDRAGETIYTQAELVKSIDEYCEGKDIYDRGDALMKKTRKPILDFARAKFAEFWAMMGRRPEHSPKVLTEEKGDGAMVTVEFQDREANLNQEQFDELAAVIGAENAKSVTTKGWEYSLNRETLETEVPELAPIQATDENGDLLYFNEKNPEQEVAVADGQKAPRGYKPKMRPQTFFDLLDALLLEKFTEIFGEDRADDKIGAVLVRKAVFKTNKGMINNLLDFVGRGKDDTAFKLDIAIEKAQVRNAIKPGALKKKEPEGFAGAPNPESAAK